MGVDNGTWQHRVITIVVIITIIALIIASCCVTIGRINYYDPAVKASLGSDLSFMPLYEKEYTPDDKLVSENKFVAAIRSIEIETPVMVEQEENETIESAESIFEGTSNQLIGQASAYSDGTITASGEPLSNTEYTCAVPLSQRHLIGSYVDISYGDVTITARINDVGGFESYGRVLDLNVGCIKAFGFTDVNEWGVREVTYAIY